jgi:hypothetical protein
VVFQDEAGYGVYHEGMHTVPKVRIILDNGREARTDRDGRYHFAGVQLGQHVVEVNLQSEEPFFYTRPSRVDTTENGQVNFGIAHLLSRVFGKLASDGGLGISEVGILISGGGRSLAAETDMDGKFASAGLPGGKYTARINPDSTAEGYSLDEFEPMEFQVDSSSPSRVTLTLRAICNIGGVVTIYNPEHL